MKERKQNIKCDCGKLIAVKIDSVIYIYCKSCKRQIPVTALEPQSHRAKSH